MLTLNATQLRTLLAAHASAATPNGKQKELAKMIGISESFLSDVLAGRREPTGKILEFFGYERVVTYLYTGKPKSEVAK